MKKKAPLFMVLFVCLAMILPVIRAQQKPKVYVDPQNNTFSTDTSPVGTEFNVSIKTADWPSPGLFSYQLELYYNSTVLEAINAEIPAGHWFTPSKPSNIFIVDGGTINQTLGMVSFAVTMLGDEAGKTGGGTLSTITFKITLAPTVGNLSSTLELKNIIFVDVNTAEVPQNQYDVVNGTYTYSGAAPPPVQKAKIYVDPKDTVLSTSTASVGTEFDVSIKAANFSAPGVYSYEFKLSYDNTLLEATNAEIPSDHWLKPSLAPGNIFIVDSGTINQTLGVVSFAATLLSSEPGKTGNGVISTITFSVTSVPSTGNFSCTLEIKDLLLVDPDANAYPQDQYEAVNGTYTITAGAPPAGADLNSDGKVNIEDIAIWGAAFGSHPGHSRWNPATDMNGDQIVDIIDAVLITKEWTG